jgi:ABC-type uncharacterized transport system YnjBCD ATPase subunit
MATITTKLDGNKLTIVIDDITKDLKPSSTGKSMLVASTGGALAIPAKVDGLKLALNLTRSLNGHA